MNSIGQKVKEIRKKTGLTQKELSLRSGVGLRFMRELEQGKKTLRLDKVGQVLGFLGCHLKVVENERQ